MGGELVASMAGRVAPERVMCVALADCLGHRRGLRPLGLGCLAVVPQLCQRGGQLAAGADAELGEYLAQVPLDRARGQEQPGADLRIGQAVTRQPGNAGLLRGQRGDGLDVALAHGLAGGGQLPARAFGERLHADRVEHREGDTQLRAGVHPAVLPAQPFPVEQVGAGQFRAYPRPAQPVDRLAVAGLGRCSLAQQRAAARLDAGRDIVAAGLRGLRQLRERVVSEFGVSCARGGLDELGQRKDGDMRLKGVRGSLPRRR